MPPDRPLARRAVTITLGESSPFVRLRTSPAVAHYVTGSGQVVAAVLPLSGPQADQLRHQRARLLRRSERRALVPVNEWRVGVRAPARVSDAPFERFLKRIRAWGVKTAFDPPGGRS